jgi:predicted aconitase
MYLTDEEKQMLDGEYGAGAQVGMKINVAIGKVYDAEKMVPIRHAHVAGTGFKTFGKPGVAWLEDLVAKGAKVRVPTTLNVIGIDRSNSLGFPQNIIDWQMRIDNAYEAMGCMPINCCTPYWCGFAPRFGEHISWSESSAVVYSNSVLGARDNREGGQSSFAGGLTGRTPYYGLHLDENRKGQVLIKIIDKPKTYSEYSAVGSYVGKQIVEKIPVFEGLECPTNEQLSTLGAAMACTGGVAMFHAVGITPEAPTLEAAFNGNKYDTIAITKCEIEEGYLIATRAKSREVDLVTIGCPQLSIHQVSYVAERLHGKRVKEGVDLWLQANAFVKGMAKQLGYLDIIEKAGAVLTQDACTCLSYPELIGKKTMACNSTKVSFYTPGSNGMDIWCGETDKCIEAALTGYFPEN